MEVEKRSLKMLNNEFEANVERLEMALILNQAKLQGESNQPEVTMAVEEPSSAPPSNA